MTARSIILIGAGIAIATSHHALGSVSWCACVAGIGLVVLGMAVRR
jgi:hypothetical protein